LGNVELNMAATTTGCEHYVRHCLLKAPCCGKFYVCRLCHDAEENHKMDRFEVKEVKCAVCNAVQESQHACVACGATFGEYYCDICHLFDKDKAQYHCQPCGICRIGPKEKYFHCLKCNLCLASDLQGNHKPGMWNVSHAVCGECVPTELSRLYGGHPHVQDRSTCPAMWPPTAQVRANCTIHRAPYEHYCCSQTDVLRAFILLVSRTCFEDMCKRGAYRCPLCMQSVGNMEEFWEMRDIEISQTPMPLEYQHTTVKILCNDCQAHCVVRFHVLGLKCSSCGSYNTVQEGGLISPPDPTPPSPQPHHHHEPQEPGESEADTQ
ncbi:hypothetical protein P4O66_005432, partial [Electrophorus voltai]